VTREVVSGSEGKRVRVGFIVLVSVSEIEICEVTMSGTLEEIVVVGTTELDSALRMVVVRGVVSD
jgi:hypothetical protein